MGPQYRGNGGGNSGNSFANGDAGAGPLTGRLKILGWEWQLAKLHTTIYDLGA